jgi:predicted RNA-binding Zn-ribbon protein involved in translation (DUF1610 family)
LSDVSFVECPNCGSTEFVEITPHKHRCAYCGTVLTSRERAPDLVRCPRCGSDNARGDRYCKQCGAALYRATPIDFTRTDPALVSIIATVMGSLFMPLLGGVLGLVLGYRALRQARAGGGGSGSEKLAKAAVVVGWIGVAFTVLPLCMMVGVSGAQLGYSICEGLFDALSNIAARINR